MATVEQTLLEQGVNFKGANAPTQGQRLTISSRLVTKLSFYLLRVLNPTGDLTFTIRKVSDKSLLNSKVWGLAGDVPTEGTWLEATFDTPIVIDDEVRILAEYSGYDETNYLITYVADTNPKADEVWTKGTVEAPTEPIADWDGCYIYTYEEEAPPAAKHTFRLDPKPRRRMSFHPNLKLG